MVAKYVASFYNCPVTVKFQKAKSRDMVARRLEVKKEHLKAACRLIGRHDWLSEKTDELIDLLFDDCKTDDERELVTQLFDRFLFVTQTELGKYIRQLAASIVNIPELSPDNTIIAAMANDSSPDSSQVILQYLKVPFEQLGWKGIQMLNRVDRIVRASRESGVQKANVIVIDEFVGSGRTAIGKKELVERNFASAGLPVNVFIRVIFCTSLGAINMTEAGVEFDYIKEVKRGVTDFELPESISTKLDLIKRVEGELSDMCGNHRMIECTLGYGRTESLFAIENSNIPNSVFPIFWWPQRKDGDERKTLFTRFMGE